MAEAQRDEEQRLLDAMFAEREQRRTRRLTEAQKKTERRAERRRALATFGGQVAVQALGTVIGGGLLAGFAILIGIIQATPAQTRASVVAVVLAVAASVFFGSLTWRNGSRAEQLAVVSKSEAEYLQKIIALRETGPGEWEGDPTSE